MGLSVSKPQKKEKKASLEDFAVSHRAADAKVMFTWVTHDETGEAKKPRTNWCQFSLSCVCVCIMHRRVQLGGNVSIYRSSQYRWHSIKQWRSPGNSFWLTTMLDPKGKYWVMLDQFLSEGLLGCREGGCQVYKNLTFFFLCIIQVIVKLMGQGLHRWVTIEKSNQHKVCVKMCCSAMSLQNSFTAERTTWQRNLLSSLTCQCWKY